jgi:hypothetical protein
MPGKKRVLVLGDSYVAALSHPDEKLATTLLARKLGPAYEVLNAAASAWSTDQELLYFEHEGASLRPDTVVLVIAPNDVREVYSKRFFRLENGILTRNPGVPPRIGFLERMLWLLLNHSSLAQWIAQAIRANDVFSILARHYRFFDPGAFRDIDHYRRDPPVALRDARALFEALLLRLDSAVRAGGGRLVVTVTPTKMEWSWPFTVDAAFRAGAFSDYVRDFAGKNRIAFLDLSAKARRMGDDALSLFIESEYHWSDHGHRFVSDELAAFLSSPPAPPRSPRSAR